MKFRSLTILLVLLCMMWCGGVFCAVGKGNLYLQVVTQPEEKVLLEFQVERGDHFYIDYTHSSDHTPVHDIFTIDEKGTIVLIEEDYDWYGAGLEFHPYAGAGISYTGDITRVFLHRPFPHFLLRVGRTAGHTLTYKNKKIPLLSIARGGDLVWIRTVEEKTSLK